MKTSVYIATSLDGFIARPDGDIDWLQQPGAADVGGDDYGYQAFMDSVDYLVMGRHSYEKVISFNIPWPYADQRVIVLSSRPLSIPPDLAGTVEAMAGEPAQICERLAERGAKHLYIDGGITIQRFLNAGLLTHLIITTIPILIGSGIPLFGPLAADVRVQHVATQAFASGFVQSQYEIIK